MMFNWEILLVLTGKKGINLPKHTILLLFKSQSRSFIVNILELSVLALPPVVQKNKIKGRCYLSHNSIKLGLELKDGLM